MDAGRVWFLALWRNPVGTLILYSAFLTHLVLALTKEYDCQLVISEDVAAVAGIDASPFPRHEIHARNREQPLAIRVIDDVRRIAMA